MPRFTHEHDNDFLEREPLGEQSESKTGWLFDSGEGDDALSRQPIGT
jgi:hypothetical protein